MAVNTLGALKAAADEPVVDEAEGLPEQQAEAADPAAEATEAAPGPAAEPAGATAEAPPNPRLVELFGLLVSRVRQVLTKVAKDADMALKADPVHGAVQYGVLALRSVVQAAQKAGKKLPFEVVMAAGLQTIKDLAEVASQKGYIKDEEIEVFLKEAWQQSLAQYAKLDVDDGVLTKDELAAVQAKIGGKGAAAGEAPKGPAPPLSPAPRGVLSGA